MKLIFHAIIFLSMTSVISLCSFNQMDRTEPNNPAPLDTSKKKVEESDPRKQADCQSLGSGGSCVGDEDCEDICSDIFNGKRDRDDCEALNIGLVEDFEILIEDLEDGEIEIDLDVLECLIDIDEEPIAKAVKKMSKSEAVDFLAEIAENTDLSDILEAEDEGMVLKNLLSRSGNDDLAEILGEKNEDANFLYLVGVGNNESAFNYLEDYIDEECDGKDEDDEDCPGGEKLQAYCKGLINWDEDSVEDFLDSADTFADEYEDVVDDVDYAYDVDFDEDDHKGSFLDFCRVVTAKKGQPIVLETCPSELKLANPDLSVGKFSFSNENYLYVKNSKGSVDTSQEFLFTILFNANGVGCSVPGNGTISIYEKGPSLLIPGKNIYDYVYLEDSNRKVTRLQPRSSSSNYYCLPSGIKTALKGKSWFVYLADRKGGDCEFYVPYRDVDDLYER